MYFFLTDPWISMDIFQVLIVLVHHVLIFLFNLFLSYSVYLSWVLLSISLIWCLWQGKMTALAVFRMALWSGLTIVVFPHPQLMIWQSAS